MAGEVTVPRLGWSMEEGIFGGWLRADGDAVREGDELFLLESDKATEAVPSLDTGTLHIAANGPQKGDVVAVGQCLGHVLAPGSAVAPPAPVTAPTAPPKSPLKTIEIDHKANRPARERQAVSPRARRTARDRGVDVKAVTGTGRNGRVLERDILAVSGSERRIRLTPLRRLIAERMMAGAHTTAPVTLTTKADATTLRACHTAPPHWGYTEQLGFLVAQILARHPLLNARWQNEELVVSEAVHLAIAVDTEAGLVAPVLRDAHRLSLEQIATGFRDLVNRARQGRLRSDEIQGGTFTLTNLGMYGIDAFTPIITPPQCAVLGVGRIVTEPAVVDGVIVPCDRITLSLTFDHRIVDGGPAARFLNDVRLAISAPGARDLAHPRY